MHYSNLVIIKRPNLGETIESLVKDAMGESGDWFDWYQIGGRLTGLFDGYDCVPLESVTDQHYAMIYRVVCEYGRFESERYTPWAEENEAKFPKQEMPPLVWLKANMPGHLAVIVDNHN